VRGLIQEYPDHDARLVVCAPLDHANAKVSKLLQLEREVKHEFLVISDADVRVPAQLARDLVATLRDPRVGLANCFYRLANPSTLAMHLEAVAINADFWSQVLQSRSLKPLDFALGAVMATRRKNLAEIGGFAALADCLADDYQLGHRIERRGHRIELSSLVVECWSSSMDWVAVWKHQLRWARTIRVCQPLPYFFSILSNPTLWALLWWISRPASASFALFLVCVLMRVVLAHDLQRLLGAQAWNSVLAPIKDALQVFIWAGAFMGNSVEWRGRRMQLKPDGTIVKI
jgi:ceramide glucosyltransferase